MTLYKRLKNKNVRFTLKNCRFYELISPDILVALSKIKKEATKECKEHLEALYKEAISSPVMINLILDETVLKEGEPLKTACSRYYLSHFKEAVKDETGKHPYNFTAEVFLWDMDDQAIIGANTSWGSAKFLDFLGRLPFLRETNQKISNKPPLLKMEILSPENYFNVDPAW